jgi:PncC family amidohydrolase
MSDVSIAERVARQLAAQGRRLVLAESCTAGLISAQLGRVPGISHWLCGSAVTYRDETKHAWLGVSRAAVAVHSAVSQPVTDAMALGVLQRTPEAHLSLAITGHLGPDAPPGLDGCVHLAVSLRQADQCLTALHARRQLKARERVNRQREAADLALKQLHEFLSASGDAR